MLRKLTVLVTTYNKPHLLKATLGQIWPHLQEGDEILVVDDGSKPDIEELVLRLRESCPVPLRYVWLPDRGYRLATARNVGLWLANNEIILQMDDDILLDPASVNFVREAVRKKRMVAGRIDWLGPQGELQKADWRFTGGLIVWDVGSMLPFGVFGGLLAYMRDDAFRAGLYCEEYNQRWGSEDADFAYRMDLAGTEILLDARLRGQHQWHPKKAGWDKEQHANRDLLISKLAEYDSSPPDPVQRPNPLVQIFVTHWKRRNKLQKCLAALSSALDVPGKIHVLVYGGQQALSDKIQTLRKGVHWHYLGPNKGAHYAKWVAAHLLEAPFAVFVDDDIYLPPYSISRLLAPLISQDTDAIVGSLSSLHAGKLHLQGQELRRERLNLNRWQWVDYSGFGISAMRAEVLECCSFDPQYFMAFGDLDFCMQLHKHEFKLAVMQIPGLRHDSSRDGDDYRRVRHGDEQFKRGKRYFLKKWHLRQVL